MIRIVVNDIAASPTSGGVYTILTNLYKEIINKNSENVEWIFLLSGPFLEPKKNVKIIVLPELKSSWTQRLIFEFIKGSKYIDSFNPDLYFSLQNTAIFGLKTKQAVYIQQTLPFFKDRYNFSFLRKTEFKMATYQHGVGLIIKILLKLSQSDVIVQTKWLGKKISRDLKIPIERFKTSTPTLDANSTKDFQSENPGEKLFFFPAKYYPYKNHEVIFEAVDELIKMGITDFKVALTINKEDVKRTDFPRQISFLGFISQDEVRKQYSKSVLLFPSIIESYGLPLVEASNFGSKILCADVQPQKEIMEGYGNVEFFDPHDPKMLAQLMAEIIDSDAHQRCVSNWKPKQYRGLVETLLLLINE